MTAKQIREKIQSCLERGEIDESLTILITVIDKNRQRREHENALLLRATWERIKQEQLKGILSRQEYKVAENTVIVGIQTIINNLDDNQSLHGEKTTEPINFKIAIFVLVVAIIAGAFLYLANNKPAVDTYCIEIKQKVNSALNVLEKRAPFLSANSKKDRDCAVIIDNLREFNEDECQEIILHETEVNEVLEKANKIINHEN